MRLRPAQVFAAFALLVISGLAGCSSPSSDDGIIRVPADAPNLTEAEERAQPGDVILIAPGRYEEQMLITTPDITVRGEDRNEVIIDGGGIRPYGIVTMADGVRVENLTVTDATFYGVLFTGLHDDSGPSAPTANDYEPWDPAKFPPLQRFLVDHVTAINNGLYGIYAFNSQNGAIIDSYASGSADSGIYVGQCTSCNISVTGNVAERNAVGFENANASGPVLVAGNRFTDNRVGMTFLSSYQEAFVPQAGNLVVGNLVARNTAADTPAQATGGFGIGIGISGGVENVFQHNLVLEHPRAGVVLDNAEDLPALKNAFENNTIEGPGPAFANVSAERAPAGENCADGTFTAFPAELTAELNQCAAQQSTGGELSEPAAPKGISFRDVAPPRAQPNLPQRDSYPPLPANLTLPSADSFPLPASDFLEDRAGTR